MGLKSKLPYHRRLLLLLLVSSWVLVACFIVFQYGREKHFKAEQLNSQLQLFNIQFLDALAGGANVDSLARQHKKPFEEQRITVIDPLRKSVVRQLVRHHLHDQPSRPSRSHTGTRKRDRVCHPPPLGKYPPQLLLLGHEKRLLDRPLAVPYSLSLREVLAADREFLWFMLGITLLMSIAGYFATRRLGHNITRLNEFAERAERGERIDDSEPFPHDELGNISNHLIRLYARLQRPRRIVTANMPLPSMRSRRRSGSSDS